MAIDGDTPYVHRQNEDGFYESICPECFRTVSGAVQESELTEAEQIHECSDFIVRTWCALLHTQ